MYINFYIKIYKDISSKKNMAELSEPVSTSEFSDTEMKEADDIDRELEELLKKQSAKVRVIGVGGGGGNTISRMREIGIKGGEMIAANTDAQDLLYTNADSKILIGKELTQGLGAGSNPKIGEEAAHESEHEIKKKLVGADMVFITCGLGGGTGTGAAPIIAQLSKKQGALTIGVVTLPFTIEGRKRIENANYGLERMESIVDTLIVIPNDKLLELADSQNRAIEAVEKALQNPLLDVDVTNASGALVNIIGGSDLSLDEAKSIIEYVGEKLGQDAKLIWGAQISEDMEKSIRVMLIVTGVRTLEERERGDMASELGIEFYE